MSFGAEFTEATDIESARQMGVVLTPSAPKADVTVQAPNPAEIMNGVYGAQLLAQQPNILMAANQPAADGLFSAVCKLGEEAMDAGATLTASKVPVAVEQDGNAPQQLVGDPGSLDQANTQYMKAATQPVNLPNAPGLT